MKKILANNWFNAYWSGQDLTVVDAFSGYVIFYWSRYGVTFTPKGYFKSLLTISGLRNKLFEMKCVKAEKEAADTELPF